MQNYTLGIMGAGNMAGAILNGILKCGAIAPDDIIVSDIDTNKLNKIKKQGVSVTTDNKLLFKSAEYIILAVKPQVAKATLADLKDDADNKKIISIMAGISKSTIKDFIGNVKVTRIMPNTPCLVGEGMCAVDASDFDARGKLLVLNIFGSLGKVVELPEKYFHAVTALSGSGPAYVYMFIQAMIEGGKSFGLSDEISKALTLQTFRGAAAMVENATDINQLIKNVCSPGGTTIEAVNHYNDYNLEIIIAEGMQKCEKRSKELSENA